jgi:hypothetical protein
VAKSKKERRSSIRHMAADDAFGVLEALERAEQREREGPPDAATGVAGDEVDDDSEEPANEAETTVPPA